MKRAQKIALLTKVLQGPNQQTARMHLQQFVDNAPRSLVIIDDLDDPLKGIQDEDTVHFTDRGCQHQMSLEEAHQYAKCYRIHTLFILPNKDKPTASYSQTPLPGV
ncbi:hypothetical protein GCM10027341_33190 [Spirosoma knui]